MLSFGQFVLLLSACSRSFFAEGAAWQADGAQGVAFVNDEQSHRVISSAEQRERELAFLGGDVELLACYNDMTLADQNGDNRLTMAEYTDFINIRSKGRMSVPEFKYLQFGMVTVFFSESCTTCVHSLGPNCCVGNTAYIDISIKNEFGLTFTCARINKQLGDMFPPTVAPTQVPTKEPTPEPTEIQQQVAPPTVSPTTSPTARPTLRPTTSPSKSPVKAPTKVPTVSTKSPTSSPTRVPTKSPVVSGDAPQTPQPVSTDNGVRTTSAPATAPPTESLVEVSVPLTDLTVVMGISESLAGNADAIRAFEGQMQQMIEGHYAGGAQRARLLRSLQDSSFASVTTTVTYRGDEFVNGGQDLNIRYDQLLRFKVPSSSSSTPTSLATVIATGPFEDAETMQKFVTDLKTSDPAFDSLTTISIPVVPVETPTTTTDRGGSIDQEANLKTAPDAVTGGGSSGGLAVGVLAAIVGVLGVLLLVAARQIRLATRRRQARAVPPMETVDVDGKSAVSLWTNPTAFSNGQDVFSVNLSPLGAGEITLDEETGRKLERTESRTSINTRGSVSIRNLGAGGFGTGSAQEFALSRGSMSVLTLAAGDMASVSDIDATEKSPSEAKVLKEIDMDENSNSGDSSELSGAWN